MKDILASLFTYLTTTSEISALVATRVYPMQLPEGSTSGLKTSPCVTFQMVSEPLETTHDRQVLCKASVQIDAWSGSYKSARELAEALNTALHGWRGAWDSFKVGGVFRTRKQDMNEPDLSLFRISQDYTINYREE